MENGLLLAATGLLILAAWWFWRKPQLPVETLLLGTWQSNRDLNIATMLPSVSQLPQAVVHEFFEAFGRLRVTYTPEAMISMMTAVGEHPESRSTGIYRILSTKRRKLTLESTDESTGETKVVVIHFVSADRYWLDISGRVKTLVIWDTSEWREYFDRLK